MQHTNKSDGKARNQTVTCELHENRPLRTWVLSRGAPFPLSSCQKASARTPPATSKELEPVAGFPRGGVGVVLLNCEVF